MLSHHSIQVDSRVPRALVLQFPLAFLINQELRSLLHRWTRVSLGLNELRTTDVSSPQELLNVVALRILIVEDCALLVIYHGLD